MQVELAQIPVQDGVTEPNLAKILDTIPKADTAGGTELLVFPELAMCGFPTLENIAGVAQTLDGPGIAAVRDAARRKGVAVTVGFAETAGGKYYNTSVLVDARGDIVMSYRKTHSWASDVGVFTPGDDLVTAEWNGVRVGILICFDIEFPETARALASLGADLLIVTNGNMDPYGPVHAKCIAARTLENQVFAVMCNRCGAGDGGLTFPGESGILDPFGEIVAGAGKEETLVKGRIDWSLLDASRRDYRYTTQRRVPLVLDEGAAPGCAAIR